MEKKINAVKLMRDIRLKLSEEYSRSEKKEMADLKNRFGCLKDKKIAQTSHR